MHQREPLCLSLLAVTLAAALAAQSGAPLAFDAASVKPAIPPIGITVDGAQITGDPELILKLKRTGGPGTSDPGRIHYPLISLKALLSLAWEVPISEIKGPDWLDTTTVAVDATMPRNTPREQFRDMLRNLLMERFELKCHAEPKPGAAASYLVEPEIDPAVKSATHKQSAQILIIDHIDKTPVKN